MKSGTTSLFEYIAQHPEICPAKDKEPEFFVRKEKLEKGMGYYEKLWSWDSSIHKYALEASTSYTKVPVFPNAAENMKQTARNFKFIYIVRDPISRIISQLGHTAMIENTIINAKISEKVLKNSIHYSSYTAQINEYAERFGKESILLLQFEDFILDPIAISNRVSNFLNISNNFQYQYLEPKNEKYNVMLSSKFKLLLKFRHYVPEPIKNKIKKFLVGNKIFRRYVNKNIKQSSVLDDELKEKIKNDLLTDINELKHNYNLDTTKWKEWNSILL